MRIGIDATSLLYGTGVSFYTSNLLRALSEIDRNNQYTVFGSSLRGKRLLEKKIKDLKLGKNFSVEIFSLPPSFLETLWHKVGFLPIEKFIGSVDVFHAWDWLMPVAKNAKIVTTIHDLAVLKFPQFFPKKTIKVQKERLRLVEKKADAVIAVSENTKRDIIGLLKISKERIYVVYEAVPVEHQLKIVKEDVEKTKQKYCLQEYILCVGTREPRKNLKGAVKAYSKTLKLYHSKTLELVIVGNRGWGRDIKMSNVKCQMSNVKFIENADDKELVCLYAGAKCFLYPSFYEGFGLPVLEAMFHGCPVITSNVSSLPEIASDAAVLINPRNVKEISQAIKRIIDNKSIYNSLKEKGLRRARKFSWKKAAEETLEVYRSIVNN